ncbi:MAG TPA: TonB-dependent receptor [Steroidobacteraceae bacterium]|nr:TonB-dependent receptor [Steroidobacteraceae bacterium]
MSVTCAIVALFAGTAVLAQNANQGTAAPSAAAQNVGAANENQLQEVIVTAQFQNQSVQQTPLAITAISADALAERGQTSLVQITQDAPSVQLAPEVGAFGPSMSAYIRGIGQSDLDPALEPGVGIYIDDVYFGTLTGSLMDLLDLDRVEVLRGPQGTLEGMNSEGGAIKLFSKLPDATESSSFDLLGGSRNHVELRASTNFAITDNLFVRLTGVGNHQDGYVTRYDFGCANPSFTATDINGVTGTYSVTPGFLAQTSSCVLGQEGGTGYAGGRASVRFVPSDTLSFTLIGDLTNTNQEAPAETLIYAGPGPLALPTANPSEGAVFSPGLAIPTTNGHLLPYDSAYVPAMIPSNFYATYANFCAPAFTSPSVYNGTPFQFSDPAACVQPQQTIRNWGVQQTTDWTIANNLSLKNIAALRGYSADWVHDNSESIWPMDLGAESMGHHQFSEELRLTGNSLDKLLDWTAGGFYFREESVYFGHEELGYATAGAPFFAPGLLNFYQNDPIDAHDKAGFLHTTWHLAPKLDLIFGYRYTAQDKEYHYVRVAPGPQPIPPGSFATGSAILVSSLNGYSNTYSATRSDWRADVDYHFTDDVMWYTQYSTGFKGGGIDPRPFYVQQAIPFKPESLATFETGVKTTWFDNHLRVNVDGYFSQYRDIQLTLLNCSGVPGIGVAYGSPCALPFNAGDGHQKGAEFESQLRFGGFQADVNASWLKFDYISVNTLESAVTPSMVTPWTPSWSGGGGIQYTVPIASAGSITARLDGSTRSLVYTGAVNDPYNRLGGYTLWNAHLSWQSAKQNWQAIIQVLNLTGKEYYLNNFDLVEAGQGTEGGTPGPPLEIDLEIKHQM